MSNIMDVQFKASLIVFLKIEDTPLGVEALWFEIERQVGCDCHELSSDWHPPPTLK